MIGSWLAIAICLTACVDPPDDEQVIKYFRNHREELQKFSQYVRELDYSGTVYLDHLHAGHPLAVQPQLLSEVRNRMRGLELNEFTLAESRNCLFIEPYPAGFWQERWKGLVQCPHGLRDSMQLVSDTDAYYQRSLKYPAEHSTGGLSNMPHVYQDDPVRKIAGSWYVYQFDD